jgi:hypothetical protein
MPSTKLKVFCIAKETTARIKKQNMKKIIVSYSSDRGLMSKIHKEQEIKHHITNSPINKWANEQSSQKKYNRLNEKMFNIVSHQREQIKTVLRFHLICQKGYHQESNNYKCC